MRTLKILLHVYMYELRLCPILDEARLERLFCGLDSMLKLHQHFLNCLKSRQSPSQEGGSANMYPVAEFADILISQVRPARTGKYETRFKLCFFPDGILIVGIRVSVVSSPHKLPLWIDFNFLSVVLLNVNPSARFYPEEKDMAVIFISLFIHSLILVKGQHSF